MKFATTILLTLGLGAAATSSNLLTGIVTGTYDCDDEASRHLSNKKYNRQ